MRLRLSVGMSLTIISVSTMLIGCRAGDPKIGPLPTNDPVMDTLFPGDPAMRPAPPGPFLNGKKYTITIKTGDLPHAGTDANVYIAFEGSKDDSEEIILDDPQRDDFERGHIDVFNLEYRDVGRIKAIYLRQDNTNFDPGWYVDWVSVRDNTTGETFKFDLHRWLAADQGDRLTKIYTKAN
jgi:hypothetical protein